ncbi:hypothetical protein AMECASPLE_032256 [Ameca splendens]|uniref:Uncharacterized protein n=1 Tax=Ameca splendens TaxID=208324 RepID=A0ABV0ZSW4_9TELE
MQMAAITLVISIPGSLSVLTNLENGFNQLFPCIHLSIQICLFLLRVIKGLVPVSSSQGVKARVHPGQVARKLKEHFTLNTRQHNSKNSESHVSRNVSTKEMSRLESMT